MKQLSAFMIPLVALAFYFEEGLATVKNSYSAKKASIERQAKKLEVLVLGSSHEYYGVNPEFFSREGFNLANTSQSMLVDAQLAEKYLPLLPRLKLLLLPISYFSLGQSVRWSGESWRNFYYFQFYGIRSDQEMLDLMNPRNVSLFFMYGPKKSREIIGRQFKIDLSEGMSEKGWYWGAPMQWKGIPLNDESASKVISRHDDGFRENAAEMNSAALRKVLALAAERKVRVALFTSPTHPAYTKRMNAERWSRTQRLISDLVTQYGVHYYDFHQDARFDDSEFSDTDHLNSKGADAFSKLLDSEVIRKEI